MFALVASLNGRVMAQIIRCHPDIGPDTSFDFGILTLVLYDPGSSILNTVQDAVRVLKQMQIRSHTRAYYSFKQKKYIGSKKREIF